MTGRSGSSAPARSRSSMPSLTISDHTPRPRTPGETRWRPRRGSGRSPAAPCRRGTRSGPPVRRSAAHRSSVARGPGDGRGASTSSARSTVSTSRRASPKVNGILGLTWATTRPPRATTCSMAAGSRFTSMPRETLPSRGAEVWTRTASGGRGRAEQPRDERQPHGQVLERRVPPDARADEGGLGDDPRPSGPALLDVEAEEPTAGRRGVEDADAARAARRSCPTPPPGARLRAGRPGGRPPPSALTNSTVAPVCRAGRGGCADRWGRDGADAAPDPADGAAEGDRTLVI